MSSQRRCSSCRQTNHDIRNCPVYVNGIDTELIDNFTENGNNAVFPLTIRRPIVYKLGDKYGLSRNLNYNTYLERLILIYIHLGEQKRQARRDRRNAENQRRLEEEQQYYRLNRATFHIQDNTNIPIAQAVVPFPLNPVMGRFRNILSIQDLNALRSSFRQLTLEIEEELIERNTEETSPSPKLVVDPSKFTEDNLICECPICYETKPSVITNCYHSYCKSCINTMIEIRTANVSCALCRENVNTIYVVNDTFL